MSKRSLRWFGALLVVQLGLVGVWAKSNADIRASKPRSSPPGKSGELAALNRNGIESAYDRLPMSFESNQGQTDSRVKFLSRGSGYTLFLTPTETVLSLRRTRARQPAVSPGSAARAELAEGMKRAVLRMRLVGCLSSPRVRGLDPLPGKSHYLVGSDPKKWRRNVPHYARVRYREVYPGIDLIFYGRQGQLEYDLVVSPAGEPGAIRLAFDGAESLTLDDEGNLILQMEGGKVVQHAPIVYQESDGARRKIPGHYVLVGKEEVGFQVARYDRAKQLVIDPKLSYSTYLGGSRTDRAFAIAVDSSGNVYLTGSTDSDDFPTASPYQGDPKIGTDVFVTKLNANGSGLIYSTYLGGSNTDNAHGIAVDDSGNVYITGTSASSDFPRWPPFPPGVGYPSPFQFYMAGTWDAFVTKLNVAGSSPVYSTYLGGSDSDTGAAVAVDPSGCAYVVGRTYSGDFPIRPGSCIPYVTCPFQRYKAGPPVGDGGADAFVTKFNAAGDGLRYSTYLGGSDNDGAHAVAVDASGFAYVTGETESTDFPMANPFQPVNHGKDEVFVTKLYILGSQLIYSSYLGGSGDDHAFDIAVDSSLNPYVTGETESSFFPTTPGAFDRSHNGGEYDAFVTKFNATGKDLDYSTFLGGSKEDSAYAIAVDTWGCAYVTGETDSADFATVNAIQAVKSGPVIAYDASDAFVTKLNPPGSWPLYSTYMGGSRHDEGRGIALDPSGNAYITGWTGSDDFPFPSGWCIVGVTCPFQGTSGGSEDAFVSKIADIPVGFTILDISPSGATSMRITWRSEQGRTYNIFAKDYLTQQYWTGLITDIVATGDTTSWTDTRFGATPSRFYRVVRLPW